MATKKVVEKVESKEVTQTVENTTVSFIYDKVLIGTLLGEAVGKWNAGETSGKFKEKIEGKEIIRPALAYLDCMASANKTSKKGNAYKVEYKVRIIEPNLMKNAKNPQVFIERLGFMGFDGNRMQSTPIERGILINGEYVEIRQHT